MFDEWGSLQKHKKKRLTGKPLAALNQKIYDRDGGCCIICGAYIQPGENFHLNAGRILRPLRSGRNARFTSLSYQLDFQQKLCYNIFDEVIYILER